MEVRGKKRNPCRGQRCRQTVARAASPKAPCKLATSKKLRAASVFEPLQARALVQDERQGGAPFDKRILYRSSLDFR